MQTTCPQCGYQPSTSARFCRQCGAPLLGESDVTAAETRSYGRQEPRYSPPAAGSPYDEGPSTDTSRLYAPPAAPIYEIPKPKRSGAGLFVLIGLLCLLVVGGIISTIVIVRSTRESGSVTRVSIEEQVAREVEEAQRQAEEAQRNAEEAAREAAEAARESGIPPPPPPAPPPPPPIVGNLTVEQLKYPNATIDKTVKVVGNDILKMTTRDDMEKVREFYQKKLGDPMVLDKDDNKTVFITTTGGGKTILTITPSEQKEGMTEINLIRTSFGGNIR